MPKAEMKIEMIRYRVPLDPSVEVFGIEIGDDRSAWMETIPSEENLYWFLRGVRAGAQMFGNKYVAPPPIPERPVPLPG